ncbi:four helix bundle protein [Candidatus Wolfebacteria bacterium]|nr:four helix bundle protein [Candidatus Wolfebacteria bacterium]
MTNKVHNTKRYDLEERTFWFGQDVRTFVKKLPKNIGNIEDGKQLVRSSGSVGANYIEANESLSKKDFVHRIRICRKESKESVHWLRLVDTGGAQALEQERGFLVQEATELMKIFSVIMRKSE